jgi:hypothetical protein
MLNEIPGKNGKKEIKTGEPAKPRLNTIFLKDHVGLDALLSMGFNLSEAEAVRLCVPLWLKFFGYL